MNDKLVTEIIEAINSFYTPGFMTKQDWFDVLDGVTTKLEVQMEMLAEDIEDRRKA